MPTYNLPDGQKVSGRARVQCYFAHHDDVLTIPKNTLGRMSPERLTQLGITVTPDPPKPAPLPPDINVEKPKHKDMVDADAERIRLKYITPGDGMMMTYREKLEQAEHANSQGQAAIDALTTEEGQTTYPTLSASVGIEAATLWDCAQLVLATYAQWATLSHNIEQIRLAAKKAIDDAATVDDVRAAYQSIDWGAL